MQITRQRIIDYLRKHGQATVEELTQSIGLTHMAVRHHLNVLQGDSLVEVSEMRRDKRPGRPVQIYVLTENAEKLYPQDYFPLADLLMEEVLAQIGPQGLSQVFNNMAHRLLEMAPTSREGQSFENRLDEVIGFLKEKGFMAKWAVEDGQYVIHHTTCPYRQLAAKHQEVCLLDARLIGTMLQVTPQRTCCIANEDGKCTYCLGVTAPADSENQAIQLTIEH